MEADCTLWQCFMADVYIGLWVALILGFITIVGLIARAAR